MKNNKIQIYYIILGIGIGLVIGSIISIIKPNIEYVEYTDQQIKQRARELGMYEINEIIEMNNKLNNEEEKATSEKEVNVTNTKDNINVEEISKKEDNLKSKQENENNDKSSNHDEDVKSSENSEEIKEDIKESNELEYIEFKVERGDSSEIVIENLFKANIINSKKEFVKKIVERDAERKIHYGKFKIPVGVDYDTLIDILTK